MRIPLLVVTSACFIIPACMALYFKQYDLFAITCASAAISITNYIINNKKFQQSDIVIQNVFAIYGTCLALYMFAHTRHPYFAACIACIALAGLLFWLDTKDSAFYLTHAFVHMLGVFSIVLLVLGRVAVHLPRQ